MANQFKPQFTYFWLPVMNMQITLFIFMNNKPSCVVSNESIITTAVMLLNLAIVALSMWTLNFVVQFYICFWFLHSQ